MGNTSSNDGCDSTWHIEMGWEWHKGTPWKVSVCSEIWGDYRNRGWYTWDDGNVVSGDGWSSTWITEAGWSCTGGGAQVGDKWVEICGDGKHAGTLAWDDQNLLDGDGCSSTWSIEVGWKCSGGTSTSKDTCIEIWGDGLNKGMWQWDDGNNRNGDGCDSKWYIEKGWDWNSGDPSYCYKKLRPWIVNYNITDDSSLITLQFNTTVLLKTTWIAGKSMTVILSGPFSFYDYSWEVINATQHMSVSTDTLYIKIYYSGQLLDYDLENIRVTFVDSTKIVDSTNGYDMIDTGVDFKLKGKETTLNLTNWILLYLIVFFYWVVIGVTFGLILLGFSGWIWIDMITTLQMIHLIPVWRLYIPTPLLRFFMMFRYLNFEEITFGYWKFQNGVNSFGYTENSYPSSYNFEKMGLTTTAFFINTSGVIFFLTYILFIPALISMVALVFYKSPSAKNLERNIHSGLFLVLLYVTLFKTMFSAMLNFKLFNTDNPSESTSSIFSILYIIFVCTFFLFLFGWVLFYWYYNFTEVKTTGNLAQDDDIRKSSFLGTYIFYHYRTQNIFYYSYPLYFITRRVLVWAVLVFWNNDGFSQLLMLSLLSATSLSYMVSYQPFRSRPRNVLNWVHEVAYLWIWMTIFPYVYPQLCSNEYRLYPIVVVAVFGIVYIFAMLLSLWVLSWKTIEKEDRIPIAQEPEPSSYTGQTNQDILNQWLEGKEFVKTDFVDPDKPSQPVETEEVLDNNKVEAKPAPESVAPSQTSKSKPSTDNDSSSDSSSSEESEESEEESEKEPDISTSFYHFIPNIKSLFVKYLSYVKCFI